MTKPHFLTLDDLLGIHADQIRRYGGRPELRDLRLPLSALGVPETTFEGEFLHGTLFEMAANYLFHIARNHPFVEGNKRTALMCALVFLGLNGRRLEAESEGLYSLVDGVSAGTVDKAEVSVFLRQNSVSRYWPGYRVSGQIGNIALKGLFDRKGLDPALFGACDRKGAEQSANSCGPARTRRARRQVPGIVRVWYRARARGVLEPLRRPPHRGARFEDRGRRDDTTPGLSRHLHKAATYPFAGPIRLVV